MANAKIINPHQILLSLHPQGELRAQDFHLAAKADPDIALRVEKIELNPEQQDQLLLTTQSVLDAHASYELSLAKTHQEWTIAPSLVGTVLTVLISAALIQNFVFTRYLGLCVFFGVSRKRETAVGMGVTFTIVGILSGLSAWVLDRFVLKPLSLDFLQIIVFIGVVACLVQMVDTIMRKVNRALHKKFGIYVVLITTNCIILAVPLLNALNETSFFESLALAVGSGLGFALALFLMSCARERADLAPIPRIFKGMPIAFILAGLFALAFLGFSGLKL